MAKLKLFGVKMNCKNIVILTVILILASCSTVPKFKGANNSKVGVIFSQKKIEKTCHFHVPMFSGYTEKGYQFPNVESVTKRVKTGFIKGVELSGNSPVLIENKHRINEIIEYKDKQPQLTGVGKELVKIASTENDLDYVLIETGFSKFMGYRGYPTGFQCQGLHVRTMHSGAVSVSGFYSANVFDAKSFKYLGRFNTGSDGTILNDFISLKDAKNLSDSEIETFIQKAVKAPEILTKRFFSGV